MSLNSINIGKLKPVYKRVEHVDTDSQAVMHFSRYASLFESAVMESFEDIGVGLSVWNKKNKDLRISEIKIKYVSSARFLDTLKIIIAVKHLGLVRFRIEGEIFKEDKAKKTNLLALGILDFAVVGLDSEKPEPIPQEIKKILEGCVYERQE